ncbi:hypothetical protein B0A48_15769 [Cryoendolithus antarcticus]|uniref:DUF6590 domain-containing protein n=1 Tax=Cryoendolithus antarcticus TaxID=1507870 RepID=A0A1V8SH85_9PEZI|nr:hypothetical protein B0A48_15769 [Cryoendolithus antarcticus]
MSNSNGWIWSDNLGKYYQYTGRPDVIITSDGVRLPVSALSAPRILPGPATARPIPGSDLSSTSVEPGPRRDGFDPSRLSTSPKYYTTGRVSSLAEGMDAMTLSTPRTEPNSAVHRGVDRQTRIQSAIKFEPKEDITQPDLYRKGVRAYGKLVATESEDNEEFLDPAYRVRKQATKFFVLGKVFLVLWAEPASANSFVTRLYTGGVIPGRHKERIFTKVRRFVVIRAGDRSCSALPILTYDHQGAKKRLLNASENGIIFTGKAVPAGAPRVPGLLDQPIRVNADDPTDKLDVESLIHYGKVYTIEHNIKVKPFGMVHDNSVQPLLQQFSNVWVYRVGLPLANPNPSSNPRSAHSQSGSASNPGGYRRDSDVTQVRRPLELTERQRAGIEQHGAVAERLMRNPSDGGRRSTRQSGRGSGAGSEAAESSTAGRRRAETALYHRLRNRLLEQGYGEEEADSRARQGVLTARTVQATSQRTTTQSPGEEGEAAQSDDDSGSGEDDHDQSEASADATQGSQASARELAIDALMARGFSREQARQVLAEVAARQSQDTSKGKTRQV